MEQIKNKKMINRIFVFMGIFFVVIGTIMLIHSFSYEKYTDEQKYKSEYRNLDDDDENRYEKFNQLRKKYLTYKFTLEDYGITLIITGIPFLLISLIGIDRLKTPSKKLRIVIIGILAALVTITSYVCDLFFEMLYRESYPHWADSIAISLTGVPFLLLISFGWVAINLIGIKNNFRTGISFFPIKFNIRDDAYSIILLLTIILTIFVIIDGYFWQVLSGFLWIYFYLSILLGRNKIQTRIENLNAN